MRILLFCVLLLGGTNLPCWATQPLPFLVTNWATLYDPQFNCSFPEGYDFTSESDTRWYFIKADSITIEINTAFDGASITTVTKPKDTLPITANCTSLECRLDLQLNTFASYFTLITNGQIISQTTLYISGKAAREIELTYYASDAPTILRRMFVRVYWDGTNMQTFSLDAETTYDTTLYLYKDMLFNSITVY